MSKGTISYYGGALMICSLLLPFSIYRVSGEDVSLIYYFWLFGLEYVRGRALGVEIDVVFFLPFNPTGYLYLIPILLSGLFIMSTSKKVIRGDKTPREGAKKWVIWASISIFFVILWIVSRAIIAPWQFEGNSTPLTVKFEPYLGIYGVLIGAGLVLIGAMYEIIK